MNDLLKYQEELKKLVERRNELFKLKKPIDEELTSTYEKIEIIKDEIGKLLIDENPLDWNLLLDESKGKAVYDKYDDEVEKRGLVSGGYFPETRQRCIGVRLIKNNLESFNKTLSGLQEILPFIKPLKTEEFNGFKYINITEITLSQYGSYFMLVNEEKNIYKLMKTVYSHTKEIKVFNTLDKIIKYIQENVYYSDGEENY